MIQELLYWNPWIQLILDFSILQLSVHVEKCLSMISKNLDKLVQYSNLSPWRCFSKSNIQMLRNLSVDSCLAWSGFKSLTNVFDNEAQAYTPLCMSLGEVKINNNNKKKTKNPMPNSFFSHNYCKWKALHLKY